MAEARKFLERADQVLMNQERSLFAIWSSKDSGALRRQSMELKAQAEAAIEEHLNFVTVDEWRALKHLYLSHRDRTQLGKLAPEAPPVHLDS